MKKATRTSAPSRWQPRALIIAAIASTLSAIGLFTNRPQFFHSYLFAWLFCSGLSFGGLVILMLQFLTGGKWGLALRSLTSAAGATLPLMALLFLPLLFGLLEIYPWARGDFGPGEHLHKARYLTAPYFIARSISYLTILSALGWAVRRFAASPKKIGALSAGGLIVYLLCMNFASTDWVMSLTPEWFSTIFVIIFAAGQFLSALSLCTILLARGLRDYSLGEKLRAKIFGDLGNLLLAFVVFFTYVTFSQFLIIWLGNLPHEIVWYLDRSRGGWPWFALALFFAEFCLPFAFLLSRSAKRQPEKLALIALCILLAQLLNHFWLIAPTFHPQGFAVHWLDFTLLLALGGFWFALFCHFLKQQPLVPAELLENE